MEGKINVAAGRQVTNKLRAQYRTATKADRGKVLDRVVATTEMGRSTARRMLTGPKLTDPGEQVDGRTLRPRDYSDNARAPARERYLTKFVRHVGTAADEHGS